MSEEDKKHGQEIEDRIRESAYLMWEQAGRLSDMAHEYWVAAEKEVLAAWRTATEKLTPGEKPEKAGGPKDEDSKPAASVAAKPARATAKPAAKLARAKRQKGEAGEPKSAKPARTGAKAAAKEEKPKKPKAAAARPAPSETPRPAKVVAEPVGETTRKVQADAAAPTKAPSTVEPTAEAGDKKERGSLRNRTSRRTREKSEVRGRTRRLGKK